MSSSGLLCLVPVSLAWRSTGFRWVQEDMQAEFSVIAPLLFGSLLLCATFFVLLLGLHGTSEVRKLCNKKYVIAALPSIFASLTFVCENFALASGISATLVVLLNKCAILPGVLGEVWLTQTRPYRTQLLTMGALLLCISVYSLNDTEDKLTVSLAGFLLGLGAAWSDAVGDLAFEATAKSFLDGPEENAAAEMLRCFFANELWKALVQAILMFAFEPEFVSDGFFDGWGFSMLVGGIVPLPVMVVVYNICILTTGNLKTRIAASVDIGIAYFFEAILFEDAVKLPQCLLILAIIFLIGVYTQFTIDMRKATADALADASEDLA